MCGSNVSLHKTIFILTNEALWVFFFFFSKYHRTWLCICLRHQTGMILCWGGEDTVCFQADLSGGIPSLYKQYSKNALILFCNWVYKMYVHMYCKILGLL